MATTKSPRYLPRFMWVAVVLTILGLAVGDRVSVGSAARLLFSMLKNDQDALFATRRGWVSEAYRGEQELLQSAFTDPLIPATHIHPPITSLQGIYDANRSLMLPVNQFFEAYDQLEIIDAALLVLDQGATHVLQVTYTLAGTRYDAYAYAVGAPTAGVGAALVIPGSGWNQSSAIYKNDPANYHFGILETLGEAFEKFILIKPNEDCLAFHNGQAKLNEDFFLNWLLGMGASYSAHYITHSLALTKYLQQHYATVVVAGLSQGGAATLLNALQSHPQVAIIASGFSVVNAWVKGAGYNQILIPGLQQRWTNEAIRARMQGLPTRFLFTYGQEETSTYKMEAYERLTCRYFAALPNVECGIHEYGHIFPVEIMRQFLSRER